MAGHGGVMGVGSPPEVEAVGVEFPSRGGGGFAVKTAQGADVPLKADSFSFGQFQEFCLFEDAAIAFRVGQYGGVALIPDGRDHVFPCSGEATLGEFHQQVGSVVGEHGSAPELFFEEVVQHVFGSQLQFECFPGGGREQFVEAAAVVRGVAGAGGLDMGGAICT